jgi:alpha-glucosidase
VGDDIGGFNGSPTPELLTRWMELGTFNPIYRNHGMKGSRDREPWVDGPEHETIRRRYIELRYQLLPYIYTSMEETSRTGIPLMRPMFLEFPDQPDFAAMETEFMFGPDLLVAPKVNEFVGPYDVKLPTGVWYDFWTGQRMTNSAITVNPALDSVPLYVKGGSVIPEQPVVQNTEETPQGPLRLMVYPGPDCHGSLYQDDGNTLDYKRDELLRMQFTCDLDTNQLQFNLSTGTAKYKPWWKSVEIVFYGIEKSPRQVSINGTLSRDSRYDARAKTVTVDSNAIPSLQVVVTN